MPAIDEFTRDLARAAFAERMDSTVRIQRGGLGATDPDTLETVGLADPVTVYEGPARVGRMSSDSSVSLGEGEISTRSVPVDVPFDVDGVQINDLVTIVSTPDAKLVGSAWRVVQLDGGGSWNALTNLTLSGWQPSSYWDGTG